MAVFNREDGQLALGSKTPVSILQEILQKKGMSPHYELIYNGVGTPDPRFKFRVTAEGITAIGDGKSKKEAKHDAAVTLLKRLHTHNVETEMTKSQEEVDIASPYTGALKTNFVGMLDEICFTNKIPTANYVLVSEEGPPHARVFTMRCNLSSISEIAVARTKKQAKHLVAQKMIDRVEEILKDRFIPALGDDITEEIVSDQENIRNGSFHHDLTHKVQDLHNVFHVRQEEQPVPLVFQKLPEKPEEFYESMENPLEFLKEVVEAMEGSVKTNYLTREKFKMDLFKSDWCKDDEDNDEGSDELTDEFNRIIVQEDKPSEMTRADVDNVLPIYPLTSDDEDEEKDGKTEDVGLGSVGGMNNSRVIEDFAAVYSLVKVEVPRGLWEFVGRGRCDLEAREEAARRAIKFLRTMAIPPSEN